MFQNIVDVEKEENVTEEVAFEENDKRKNIRDILKKVFTKQNLITYILAFMLSMVSSVSGIRPFGLAIFTACISNAAPAGIVYICTLIGTGIGFDEQGVLIYNGQGVLTYILTSLVFIRSSINLQTMVRRRI